MREPVGRPCGYIIPKYVNTVGPYRNKNFLRGYYFAGDGRQELYGHAFSTPGFGREFRDKVRVADSVLIQRLRAGRVPAAAR